MKRVPDEKAWELFGKDHRTSFELGPYIKANEKLFGTRTEQGSGLQTVLELTDAGKRLFGTDTITLAVLYSKCGQFFTAA